MAELRSFCAFLACPSWVCGIVRVFGHSEAVAFFLVAFLRPNTASVCASQSSCQRTPHICGCFGSHGHFASLARPSCICDFVRVFGQHRRLWPFLSLAGCGQTRRRCTRVGFLVRAARRYVAASPLTVLRTAKGRSAIRRENGHHLDFAVTCIDVLRQSACSSQSYLYHLQTWWLCGLAILLLSGEKFARAWQGTAGRLLQSGKGLKAKLVGQSRVSTCSDVTHGACTQLPRSKFSLFATLGSNRQDEN